MLVEIPALIPMGIEKFVRLVFFDEHLQPMNGQVSKEKGEKGETNRVPDGLPPLTTRYLCLS